MAHRPRSHSIAVALLALAILVSGCGSTAQQVGAGQAPLTGEQGLGDSGMPAPGTPVGPTTAGSGAVGLPTASASGSVNPSASAAGPNPDQPFLTPQASGAAVTKPITIGVVQGDPTKLASAFGMQSDNQDIFIAFKRMFAYVNKHGGLAGRQIQPVYYAIDAASPDQPSAFQAACTYVTQDKKVDVVLSLDIGNVQGFAECVGRRGIPQLDAGQYTADAVGTKRTPNLFTPDALAHDLTATALIRGALARGQLTRKDTLGVLTQDCPADNRVYDNQIVPLARAAGVKVERATVNCINGNADIGAAASQISSAVLKFRTDGVTVVTLVGAPEGGGILFFSQAASQQKYRPSYLITSNAFAYANSQQGTWARDQLAKMSGISWSPILDVGLKAPTTPRQARAQAACRTMDPTRGQADGSTSPENLTNFFYSMCDTLQLLKGMLTVTRGTVSVPALTEAYRQAAASVASAKLTGGIFTSQSGRRDGVSTVIPFSYKASGCQCFSFDGPGQPVG